MKWGTVINYLEVLQQYGNEWSKVVYHRKTDASEILVQTTMDIFDSHTLIAQWMNTMIFSSAKKQKRDGIVIGSNYGQKVSKGTPLSMLQCKQPIE